MLKRVGVVGTFVWDTIWLSPGGDGPPREQWGGIVYSLAAFSAALPEGWSAEPIIKVGDDFAEQAVALLESLPNVSGGPGLRVVQHPNPRVELRYQDPAHRTERLSGGVPGWDWPELEPLLASLDAIYVNFMTGSELDLATARTLRERFSGPIYADLHSLFLEPPGEGPRPPRPLPRWREWLACFDVVQLNAEELRLLAGDQHPVAFFATIPSFGPCLALVTRGGDGADFVEAGEHGASGSGRRGTVPVPGGSAPGDPTGCGDVWGSVMFSGLLAGLGVEAAIERAHRLAARKVGSGSTASLRSDLWQAERRERGA